MILETKRASFVLVGRENRWDNILEDPVVRIFFLILKFKTVLKYQLSIEILLATRAERYSGSREMGKRGVNIMT